MGGWSGKNAAKSDVFTVSLQRFDWDLLFVCDNEIKRLTGQIPPFFSFFPSAAFLTGMRFCFVPARAVSGCGFRFIAEAHYEVDGMTEESLNDGREEMTEETAKRGRYEKSGGRKCVCVKAGMWYTGNILIHKKGVLMENDKRIAVLIDADNVSDKYLKYILDEISNHGTPTYKRIYGDWTKPQMSSWKAVLLNFSITPIQQYSYTTGKNATDSALIIDAMDILYSSNVEGFCIVSSDSDFTKLAARLRESGMYVLGMGEKKTPPPFIAACEKFKYLEVLVSAAAQGEQADEATTQQESVKDGMAGRKDLIETIKVIVDESSDEDGWAYLGEVGKRLTKRYPDFDTRNYGYKKLTPFISSLKQFDVQFRKTSNPGVKFTYIKNKESK